MKVSFFRTQTRLCQPQFGSWPLAASLAAAMTLLTSPVALARPSVGWVSTTLENGSANLRRAASTRATIVTTAPNGSRFEIGSDQVDTAGYRWYRGRRANATGDVWIRGDLLSFVAPLPAQPRESCDQALTHTDSRLRAVSGTQIRSRSSRPHGYSNGPTSRPNGLSYDLGGPGAADVLASPVFMNQVAAQIIENCPEMGLVTFSQGNADSGYVNYGWMPGRLVRPFQCKPFDDNGTAVRWGESICL